MPVGIEQREAFAAVGDAHAFRVLRFAAENGVLHLEAERRALLAEPDADEARFVGGDAVFEGILHEGNQQHGRDSHRVVFHLAVEADLGELVQPQGLQGDILVDVLHLLAERYEVAVGVVVHVLRQVDEALQRRLGLVGLGDEQPVERIERVEQKMRIDLRLVERQFGLVALVLHLFAGQPLTVGLGQHPHGEAEDYYNDVMQPDGLLILPRTPRRTGNRPRLLLSDVVEGRRYFVGGEEQRDQQGDGDRRQGIYAQPAFVEQPRNDEVFVGEIGDVEPADERAEKQRIGPPPPLHRKGEDHQRQEPEAKCEVDIQRCVLHRHEKIPVHGSVRPAKVTHFSQPSADTGRLFTPGSGRFTPGKRNGAPAGAGYDYFCRATKKTRP